MLCQLKHFKTWDVPLRMLFLYIVIPPQFLEQARQEFKTANCGPFCACLQSLGIPCWGENMIVGRIYNTFIARMLEGEILWFRDVCYIWFLNSYDYGFFSFKSIRECITRGVLKGQSGGSFGTAAMWVVHMQEWPTDGPKQPFARQLACSWCKQPLEQI